MSLELNTDTDEPIVVKSVDIGENGETKVYINDLEIGIKDFCAAFDYVLRNTDLINNDARLELLDKIAKYDIVDGWNQGSHKIGPCDDPHLAVMTKTERALVEMYDLVSPDRGLSSAVLELSSEYKSLAGFLVKGGQHEIEESISKLACALANLISLMAMRYNFDVMPSLQNLMLRRVTQMAAKKVREEYEPIAKQILEEDETGDETE